MMWLIVLLLFIFLIIITIGWAVHVSMTKTNSREWGWGGYYDFIREFKKYKWDTEDGLYKGSYWDRNNNCKYHAQIIKINGIGMIIRNPFEYMLVVLFMRRYAKLHKKPLYNWSKNF
jgi:hypothetical protein